MRAKETKRRLAVIFIAERGPVTRAFSRIFCLNDSLIAF